MARIQGVGLRCARKGDFEQMFKALAMVGLLVAMSGCSHAPAPIRGSGEILAGSMHEVNLELDGTVSWVWNSTSDLTFNVHSHGARGIVEYHRVTRMNETSSFTSPHQGIYSLMWSNGGSDSATFSYVLKAEGKGKLVLLHK